MDDDPHSPEAALKQLTALETISADLRPQALTRVTAFVKGHLEALIKSQAQLAIDRLAVEADRQKLVEDTSVVCQAIQDTITTQHKGVTENLASPIAEAHDRLEKCLKLQNDQKVAIDGLTTGARAIVTAMETVNTAIGDVSSVESVTKMDKKVDGIVTAVDTMNTAIGSVSSAKSITNVDKKIDNIVTAVETMKTAIGSASSADSVTKIDGKVDSIVAALGLVPSAESVTNVDKKVDIIATAVQTMTTAIGSVSSDESVTKMDKKVDGIVTALGSVSSAASITEIDKKVDTLTTELGKLELTKAVTTMGEKVDSAVSTFNTAKSTLDNVKPALDGVNRRFEAIDKAKKSDESSTKDKLNAFQKFLENFAEGSRKSHENLEKTTTSRFEAIAAAVPVFDGTVVPTSQVIVMELEKDNKLLRADNRSLIDRNNELKQDRKRLSTELAASKSKEDELKERLTKTNQSLLDTLDAYKKVRDKLLDQEKSQKDATDGQIQGISGQVSQMLTITTDRVKHLESKVEDLTARLTDARDDGMVLQLEAERFKNKLREYRENEAIYKSNAATLQTYGEDLNDRLKGATDELREIRSAYAKTAEERKKMSEARDKEATRAAQLQKDVEAANGTAHSRKTALDKLKIELGTTKTQLQEAQRTSQEVSKLSEERDTEAARVAQIQKDVEAAETEADKLRTEVETTKASLQEAQRTSQATQIKLDEEQNKSQKANEQLEEMGQRLREATTDLDQKRARLLELEQSGHANPLKRRRSRSPQRDLPTRTDWGHAPEWLMRNLNLIQPCQDAREDFPSTENVFCEIASLLITERSHRALKEFLEYAELDEMYCFNTALDCEAGQKAASIKDEDCHVHKDSEDDYCLPVYLWERDGKKLVTFYQA